MKPSWNAFRRRNRPARRRCRRWVSIPISTPTKAWSRMCACFNGELKPGQQVKLLHSGKTVEVKEVGSFNPKPYACTKTEIGETGYFTANIKTRRK